MASLFGVVWLVLGVLILGVPSIVFVGCGRVVLLLFVFAYCGGLIYLRCGCGLRTVFFVCLDLFVCYFDVWMPVFALVSCSVGLWYCWCWFWLVCLVRCICFALLNCLLRLFNLSTGLRRLFVLLVVFWWLFVLVISCVVWLRFSIGFGLVCLNLFVFFGLVLFWCLVVLFVVRDYGLIVLCY